MGKGQRRLTLTEESTRRWGKPSKKEKFESLQGTDAVTFTEYANRLVQRGLALENADGRFEILQKVENTVTVRDYYKGKDFDVILKSGRVFCLSDRESDCDHVGFVLADPEIIKRAKDMGVKLRRADWFGYARFILQPDTKDSSGLKKQQISTIATPSGAYGSQVPIEIARELNLDYGDRLVWRIKEEDGNK